MHAPSHTSKRMAMRAHAYAPGLQAALPPGYWPATGPAAGAAYGSAPGSQLRAGNSTPGLASSSPLIAFESGALATGACITCRAAMALLR